MASTSSTQVVIEITQEHVKRAKARIGSCSLSLAVLDAFPAAACVEIRRYPHPGIVVNVWNYRHRESTWRGRIERSRDITLAKVKKQRPPDHQGTIVGVERDIVKRIDKGVNDAVPVKFMVLFSGFENETGSTYALR